MIVGNFKPWEPKVGEWCVFWDNDFQNCNPFYTIAKYKQPKNNRYIDVDCAMWENIAPFEFIRTLRNNEC
jgi:hypothetical protein